MNIRNSRLTLAFLLLILAVPPVVADEPPENGPYPVYYDNGQKKSERYYKDGKRDGLQTYWHENGQKSSEEHFKNGELDGLITQWHENGQKKVEAHYKNGKSVGIHTWWDDEGKVISQREYEDGKLIASHTNHIEQDMLGLSKAGIKKRFGRPPDTVGSSGIWYYHGTFYDPDSEKFMKRVTIMFGSDKTCIAIRFRLD